MQAMIKLLGAISDCGHSLRITSYRSLRKGDELPLTAKLQLASTKEVFKVLVYLYSHFSRLTSFLRLASITGACLESPTESLFANPSAMAEASIP